MKIEGDVFGLSNLFSRFSGGMGVLLLVGIAFFVVPFTYHRLKDARERLKKKKRKQVKSDKKDLDDAYEAQYGGLHQTHYSEFSNNQSDHAKKEERENRREEWRKDRDKNRL